MPTEPVFLLHGAGQHASAWDGVIAHLPEDVEAHAVDLPGVDDGTFTLDRAVERILTEIEVRGLTRVRLVGLSLGAMVATLLAARVPMSVASLVLSGGQVRPNRALMAMQLGVMRAVPTRVFTSHGMEKSAFLAVLRQAASVDLRADLARITAPTLVLCGARDRPNLPGARVLAAGIAGARLRVVPGVGHEWNTTHPELFAAEILR